MKELIKLNRMAGKKVLAAALVFAMVLSMMPNQTTTVQAAKKATVKSLKLTKPVSTTLVLKKGKTYSLKAKLTVSSKKVSTKVKYTSSKKSIASISSKGKIKAKKAGTTIVKVTSVADKKKSDKVKVIVGTPVTKVKLNKSKIALTPGAKFTLKKTISPKKASVKTVSYTSSKKSVAKVSSKGVVTAVAAGTAFITAKAKDGSAKKAKCTVTVTGGTNPTQQASADIIASINGRCDNTFDVALTSPMVGTTFSATVTGAGPVPSFVGVRYTTTMDNLNYKLQLDRDINAGHTLNITATNAAGTETQSLQYFPEMYSREKILNGTTSTVFGTRVTDRVVNCGQDATWTLKAGVVPAGLTLDTTTDSHTACLYGTSNSVQNGSRITLNVKDRYGRSTDADCVFVIGSPKEIAVYAPESTITPGQSVVIKAISGGSGYYDYELRGESITGTSISTSSGSVYTQSNLAPGDYVFPMTAVDENDSSIRKDFDHVVHVVAGVKVSGQVMNLNRTTGKEEPLGDAHIEYYNIASGKTSYGYCESYDDIGTYSVNLVPGKYSVTAYSDGRVEKQGILNVTGDMVQNYTMTTGYKVMVNFEVPDGVDQAKSTLSANNLYGSNQAGYFFYADNGVYSQFDKKFKLIAHDSYGKILDFEGNGLKAHFNLIVNGADTTLTITKDQWFHSFDTVN